MFRDVKGRLNWNGYWKLTMVPHWGSVPEGFSTTARQIVMLLALGAHPPFGGAGGRQAVVVREGAEI
jgi:hypothetical protein